jgi:peptidoglycan/LPS O-acetylase OafA/YrhL
MQHPATSKRIPYLDGLRGIAAVIVFLNHFAASFFPAIIFGRESMIHAGWERALYATPLGILTNGSFAVHLFIALSAFVLLRKVYLSSTAPRALALIGRYLRLMLPILASSIIAFILLRLSGGVHVAAAEVSGSPWLQGQWPAVASFWEAMRQGVWDTMWVNASTYNSNLWMMHYIWYGSLVAFGMGAFVRWPRFRVPIYLLGLVLSWNTVFVSFWFGALLCHYYSAVQAYVQKMPRSDALGFIFVLLGILLGSIPTFSGNIPTAYQLLQHLDVPYSVLVNCAHSLAVALSILGILLSSRMQKFLSTRVFLFVGRVSFASYLLHVLLISSLASWLMVHFVSLPYQLAAGWTFLTTTVVLAVTSALFNQFIEKPTERFARFIGSR